MEVSATTAAVAGPSSEVSTPAAYEDDSRHGHFAITASQVSKPTASIPPIPTPSQSLEMTGKDLKSFGTRFHEDCHETDTPTLRVRSSRMFKGKEQSTVEQEKKPLRLLDLPVDILKEVVKEVTHTNDLTALALCHSALHRLAIPHIYSRFDIVWPDSTTHAEPRSGVDALTYGLATLVMAEEIFGEAPNQRKEQKERREQANRFSATGQGKATETAIRRRRGNHYAQFTRKFSLGNGPSDWVQEYLITKEGGKMLGTLVALAVARMRSLETFVWDMPTGILRDVWLALSSLGDRDDRKKCRLEKVWVRWHDNSAADLTHPIPPPPAPVNISTAPPPSIPAPIPNTSMLQIHPAALDRVEHPSFSILPALKSLSVLDIDELAYLDEMAVLIGKSLDKLKELRVGIALHAFTKDWLRIMEDESFQQVDPEYPTAGALTIGEKRLGGVIGILTGFVCNIRQPRVALPDRSRLRRMSSRAMGSGPAAQDPSVNASQNATTVSQDALPELPEEESESSLAYPPSSPVNGEPIPQHTDEATSTVLADITEQDPTSLSSSEDQQLPFDFLDDQPVLSNRLRLESLELERVPIYVPVLLKAVDWSCITSLTLLHCGNDEPLWKTLRRDFAPTPKSPYAGAQTTSSVSPKKLSKAGFADSELDFKLNLKKIHTNQVSPALLSFIKETLAPNTLEVLFLQDARNNKNSVTVEAIHRGPLRRHRGSLKKVLIDSSEKSPDGLHANSSRWRRWMLSRDILAFICSGKMPALRELGMAIDYRDWHFFLQRLPSIPGLRSLYLPFLADHVHGANQDPRELALQIVDIVALRPEVELCYMGIASKCFEILENRRDAEGRPESQLGVLLGGHVDPDSEDDDEDDDGDEEEDPENADNDTEDDDADDDDTDSEADGPAYDESRNATALRLREILFYDDKVAIFKARHGRL